MQCYKVFLAVAMVMVCHFSAFAATTTGQGSDSTKGCSVKQAKPISDSVRGCSPEQGQPISDSGRGLLPKQGRPNLDSGRGVPHNKLDLPISDSDKGPGLKQDSTTSDNYQVDVEVSDRSQDVLQAALLQAFEQVLVKVSGDPEVGSIEAVRSHLDEAQNYVERYEYFLDSKDPNHKKLILRMKFSSKSLRELLGKNDSVQDESSPGQVSLHIYGINDLNDFSAVIAYVRALNTVSNVEASTVDEDDVMLTVKTSSGLEALKKMIASDDGHHLQPVESKKKSSDNEEKMLTYRWSSVKEDTEVSADTEPTDE
jgi:hypothetical protein